jgi:predicted thioesterase
MNESISKQPCSQPSAVGTPRFELGTVVATPAALAMLEGVGVSPLELVRRHLRLDPGSLDAEDQASNVMALQTGARIFSAYEVGDCRERVWVITDAKDDDGHRLSTCVLMPADY